MDVQVGSQHFSPQRIFCIGKNYAEHVKELGGSVPGQPVVFMKPVSCLVSPGETIRMPSHGSHLHHEAEVVVLIGKLRAGIFPSPRRHRYIAGSDTGFGFDVAGCAIRYEKEGLAVGNIQSLRPERSSWNLDAFYQTHFPLDNIPFQCSVNGIVRQTGNTGEMMFAIPHLDSLPERHLGSSGKGI